MQKHGIVQKFTAFLLAVALSLIMIPSQIVYADYNGGGTGEEGTSGAYTDGASAAKSFLRCYVIEPEHGAAYSQAVDVFYGSVPSGYKNGQDFGYQVSRITPNITSIQDRKSAPAGLPKPYLYSKGSFIGNGAAIKAWMMQRNSTGDLNINGFIESVFGSDVLDLFKDTTTEKVLVIEPGWWHGVYVGKTYTGAGFIGTAKDWMLLYHDLELPNGGVMKDLDNTVGQTCMMLERPILGINCEYPAYSNINVEIFADHGYGLHTFSNLLAGQTTCDEPLQPGPHDPPNESKGKVTIVKSYRLKDTDNNYTHIATTSRSEVDGNITIENETGWNVVGWRASATTNTGVTGAPSWNAPSDQGQGTHAQKVNIKPNHCLYVLLEKVEEEPDPIDPDVDYIISQSRITKKISMSAPVSSNDTLRNIVNKEFKWSIAAHKACQGHTCHGCACTGHSHWDPTAPTGTYDNQGNEILGKEVEDPCPNGGKDPGCCPGHEDVCVFERPASWHGTEILNLSLNNYKQEDYQDILVPQASEEWNVETREAEGTEKGFYDDQFAFSREDNGDPYANDHWEESGWDYTCVIMRGKDKLTLSEWINNGEGNQEATEALGDLVDISDAGFMSGDVPLGTRKQNDYNDNFKVYLSIDDNYDIETTWKAIKQNSIPACRCGGNPNHGSLCTTTRTAYSNNWSSGNIKVLVQCYSGKEDTTTNDQTVNEAPVIVPATRLSGYNTTSGRMVKGKTITFYPYIEMQYDKVIAEGLPAFVMGQFSRSITVNDFAEINWNKQGSENLTIYSNQWSTHAQAKADYGAENVIPGGAQLGVTIKEPDRQTVNVTSYQVVLDGTGLTQVEKTGSYDQATQTIPAAQGEHAAYVNSVVAGLEYTSIIQYASDDKDHPGNVWNFGDKVYPGSSLACIGSSLTGSTEDKYYFRDEGNTGDAQQGDFDVIAGPTEMHTYTFYTTTSGGINCSVDNTSPQHGENNASSFMRQLINERTGVETKLALGVEHGTGNDPEAHTGTTWYNEAFDGVTIVVQSTNLTVGYLYPTERINVIDPKLTPPSQGQSDNFKDYNVSQYRTQNYSAMYGTPYVMGNFKFNEVQMTDLDDFFWSRKFWIPDFTTQDQH